MGFFSWNCSCCNESIKNVFTEYDDGIVLVAENRIIADRSYNGYGDVKGQDIFILAKYKGNSEIISKIYNDRISSCTMFSLTGKRFKWCITIVYINGITIRFLLSNN